jgi:hypothetical protein
MNIGEEAKSEGTDSGVGSADSVDFQDALANLKALSGEAADLTGNDKSEQKTLLTACIAEKQYATNVALCGLNREEKDVVDQIDDIVNGKADHDTVVANGDGNSKPDVDGEEDDILLLANDDQETKKEVTPPDVLETRVSGNGIVTKNPPKIGDKVKSKVQSIVSKFVQSNPAANSLLVKSVKLEGSADSGGSGTGSATSSPLPGQRQDKGNLFDNLDTMFDRDTCSRSPVTTQGNDKSPLTAPKSNMGKTWLEKYLVLNLITSMVVFCLFNLKKKDRLRKLYMYFFLRKCMLNECFYIVHKAAHSAGGIHPNV